MCPKTGGTAGIPAGIASQYPISILAGIPVGDVQPGRQAVFLENAITEDKMSLRISALAYFV